MPRGTNQGEESGVPKHVPLVGGYWTGAQMLASIPPSASNQTAAVHLLSSPRRERRTRPHTLWYKDQMSHSAGHHCGCALLSFHSLTHAEPEAWKTCSLLKTKSHSSFQGLLQASPPVRSHPRLLLPSRLTRHSGPHLLPSICPLCLAKLLGLSEFAFFSLIWDLCTLVAFLRCLPLPLPLFKTSRKPSPTPHPPLILVVGSC